MNFVKNPCIGILRTHHRNVFKGLFYGLHKRHNLPICSSLISCSIHGCKNLSTTPTSRELQHATKHVLYRHKWIKQLRLLSRVKILHVVLVTGLTVPMCVWYSEGIVSGSLLITTVFAASATTAGLFALSYFIRRVIGELSYDQSNDKVTISSLTFWGNRRDKVIPLSCLIPMSEYGFDRKNLFHRVELLGDDFNYLLNLRHGMIYDYNTLVEVLGLDNIDLKSEKSKTKEIVHEVNEQ